MTYEWKLLLDPSLLVLIIIACGTIWYGSFRAYTLPVDLTRELKDSSVLQTKQAIIMPVVGSVVLVLLFFFLDWLYYLLVIMISFSATVSISFIVSIYVETVCKRFDKERQKEVKYIGTITTSGVISVIIALILVIVWNVTKHFVMTDILAICLASTSIAFLRLPSMKLATILLSIFFFYDIFWVFLSGFIFHESVMVSVASRLPTLPLLVLMPRFIFEGYSMLGVGDMVLPGLFLSYLYTFDKAHRFRLSSGYFIKAMFGYFIALILTIVMVMAMNRGQPALLYLVPFTLIPTAFFGWRRGELYELWNGVIKSDVGDEESQQDDADEHMNNESDVGPTASLLNRIFKQQSIK